MFSPMRIFTVVPCLGLGIILSFLLASSPALGKDLFSALCSYKDPDAQNDGGVYGGFVLSPRRPVWTHAVQNDPNKTNAYFGFALKHAAPGQTPAIAAHYAGFLLESGDLHKAELILKQALTQSPDDVELTKMLARCLIRQERIIEGFRYFQSVDCEVEAKAEIAAFYRKQGNTDMLAAVEKKWGTTGTTRPGIQPELVRSEPVLVAAKTIPSPVLPTRTPTLSAPAPTEPTPSQSALSNAKIPVPVPNSSPQPMAATVNAPKPTSAAPVPKLVAPVPAMPTAARPTVEKLELANCTLVNPVKLSATSQPVPAQSDEKVPSRPATGIQPRKHYVVNADTSADLDALFPIKPVVAIMPVRK